MEKGKERQSDKAYRLIKEAIVNRELKPGDLLQELEMVERFHIGRTPLREAIQRLTVDGLVTNISRKGAFVTIMTKDDIKNVFELRCNLDAFAARLAAERASASEIIHLESIISDPEFNEENKVIFDERIHKAISQCAHNNELEKLLNSLYIKSVCMFSMEGFVRESAEKMKTELMEIIDMIKNRNADGAYSAALKHVMSRNWFN